MFLDRKAAWFCLGLGLLAAAPATAQYYDPRYDRGPGYDRRYDRPDDYRRRDDRGYGYGDNRGGYRGPSDRGPRDYGQGARPPQGRGNPNPMAGMSIEEQKRAIKNHREAQKRALKKGYVIP